MLAKSLLGLIFFLLLSASSIGAQYWPTTKWEKSSPHAQGFEPKSIHELFQFMQKRKFPIDSVVIVKNGYLIGEFYADKNNEETIGNIYSVTKSFTSALVGIAIDKGHIKSCLLYTSDAADE